MLGFWKCLLAAVCLFGLVHVQAQIPDNHASTKRYHGGFEASVHEDTGVARRYLDSLWNCTKGIDSTYASYYYHFDFAYYHFTQHRMDVSIAEFEKSLQIARKASMGKKVVDSKVWLANHAYLRHSLSLADSLYHEVLEEAISLDYTDGIANGLFGLSSLQEDEEKALQHLIRIDSLYQARKETNAILANTLGEIGKIYLKSDNLPRARHYYQKALLVARENNYQPGISNNIATLGHLAMREGDFPLAKRFYQEVYENYESKHDTLKLSYALQDLAEVALATGQNKQAVTFLKRAERYFKKLRDSISFTHTSLLLSRALIGTGNFSIAREHLDYVRTHPYYLSKADFIRNLLETEISYYEGLGNFRQAFQRRKSLDSLIQVDIQQRNTEAFMALEQRYNAAENAQQIALLKKGKAMAEQERLHQRNLLLGGLALTSIAVIFLFILYRNRQKTTNKLQELDRLKSNLFANISHEFRTPLTLITTPLEDRLADEKLKGKERSDMKLMYRNARRLQDLVTQLLDLSKLESGKYHLQVRNGLPEQFLRTMGESFRYLAKQHQLNFQVRIQALGSGWFDQDLLEKVVGNILSNAMKYTPKDGQVNFIAERRENHLVLLFENSCPPLKEHEINQLFDRFYQADEHAEGAGIGLALVKELLRLARGTIRVGHRNTKLRFEITIPINEAAFSSHEKGQPKGDGREINIPDATLAEGLTGGPNSREQVSDLEDKDILLVVEDHHDVRAYIVEMFEKDYVVLEAENGRLGIQQAIEHVPDLIISDIMMPEMDGLTLCSHIKNDERTSHIPILLLTARAGEEAEYAGLHTGADHYVIKPFKRRLLETRVRNLIASRRKLRERYRQEIILKPRDISITPVDEQFLNKVQEILDQRLIEPTFNITEFSEALGMSRMQLHRKLKALTGLSTSGFIRSQRLKQALGLLKKGGVRISEIGYRVGFNDPSYFSKCFKSAYGKTPSEYLSHIPPG